MYLSLAEGMVRVNLPGTLGPTQQLRKTRSGYVARRRAGVAQAHYDDHHMITFLAVLTLAGQVALVLLALAVLVQLLTSRRPVDAIRATIGRDALRISLLVASVAMAGSLYFSEVRNFQPCVLCWYQRIAMYPLVPILAVANLVGDRSVFRYVLPLVIPGALISSYHVQLELFPDQETIACTTDVPCTTIWFNEFGYITIPVMAGTAFLLVAALTWLGRTTHGQGIAREA